MNLKKDIVRFSPRYKPIPKPYYVTWLDSGHFMVCSLNEKGDLLEEHSAIHWNRFTVRRWALEIAARGPDALLVGKSAKG